MSKRYGKSALVLAGGGLTGAVYEIGALRAIDDLLVDRTVNDFDIFVGTSAGALVSALLANGVSPEEMLGAIEGRNSTVNPIQPHHLFSINYHDIVNWGLSLPKKLASAWSHYLRNIGDMTAFDLLISLAEALPAGIYDGLALEEYVKAALDTLGISNTFTDLPRDLYIIATDLDSGERVVFGQDGLADVPISLAVAASSAIPLVYKPVRIGDNEYVDGGLRGNASLDLAIEHGADLIICINPMVPYDNSDRASIPFLGPDGGYLSQKGIQAIANQTLRITSHAGLHYHVKQLRRAHPQVDIILIEPKPEDFQMFFYNIMRYSARLTVARHGFESATLGLAEDYPRYKQTLARHGIPISRRLVIEEIAEIQESGYDSRVIQRVLQARSRGCGQRRRDDPICQLSQTLAKLEMALDELETATLDYSPG
jgi:predicted acylesterase/phospholipase RssA